FSDLVDTVYVQDSTQLRAELERAGFVRNPVSGAGERFVQEKGIFPAVVLHKSNRLRMDLKVESVADSLSIWQVHAEIEGPPLGALRRARITHSDAGELWVVERHGYRGYEVPEMTAHEAVAVLKHFETLRLRRRLFDRAEQGFAQAHRLLEGAIADLGMDRACDLFFAAEREYWQRRNRAAQVQKTRQDKLGIGWANHDHHTYRSSREHFARLIGVFEKLGFHCRERFYAGAQAGWGAQVLEQPTAGIIIFADVDLSPDELFSDFSHEGLAPREKLGTVGLWCALHGEAFVEAGMHHLECQFDFDALKSQLESEENVKVMKPFTNFPYLRQAFTEGEIWPVRPERIERLLTAGRITQEQAEHFRTNGALGSHLENLERNQGFKGFNQTGVSEIISRTDPRAQMAQH
ncbi:MAG TPA: hypothetical protein VN541_13095, partial [Tepidisphaeraceae bacterium]|nr:hypothetical protein [Tepidisphaeraceae bacterium]